MPSKNATKIYVESGYYHIYNRGVEKRLIYLDDQDYSVFLSYLKDYLLPKDEEGLNQKLLDPHTSYHERDKILKLLHLKNYHQDINLLAYCLMPNHFHFFVKQTKVDAIDRFMRSFGTRYSMYFNRKYKRVGSLYQGVYKAVLVDNEGQFLHLSRYIHKQALEQNQPSSYPEYIGKRETLWIKHSEILSYYFQSNPYLSYEHFVAELEEPETIKDITLDEY